MKTSELIAFLQDSLIKNGDLDIDSIIGNMDDEYISSYLDTIAKWGNCKLENDIISLEEESFLKSVFSFINGDDKKFFQE